MEILAVEHGRPIVLVENSLEHALLVREALGQSELAKNIMILHDGEELLEYLFHYSGTIRRAMTPQVVLLDLHLRKLSGLDVLRAIRKHSETRTLPVVIFTSSDSPKEIAESYRLGANSYIRKPIIIDEMIDAIYQVARYWAYHNHLERT